jgi:hypothetical protein
MARNNPALFLGATFAIGLLVGRFLRAGDPGPDVTFEPEGEGETGRRPGGDARSRGSATRGEEEAMRASGLTVDEPGFEAAMPQRAMTPDLENLSDAHPSSPGPGGVRERFADETPVRSGFAGHETTGPGVRTGSSGAAALDAGSAGPRQDEHDSLRTRRRESGEEDA